MATEPNSTKSPLDLESWHAALVGDERTELHAESPTVSHSIREGTFMRKLFLSRTTSTQPQASPSPKVADANWDQILKRAQQQGLFDQSAKETIQRTTESTIVRNKWTFSNAANQRWYAVAAGFAVLGIGISIVLNTTLHPDADGGDSVMRGDELAQRVVVPASEIASKVQQMEAIFGKHKIVYNVNRSKSSTQIQAKVPANSVAAVELSALGIAVPAHGRVNIIFVLP